MKRNLDVRRLNLILALALVVIVAVGVVILVGGGSGSSAATQKQLAERAAEEHLAAVSLPPGSHRVASLPASVQLEASKPKAPDEVSRAADYVSSMGPAEARAWFAAHPPAAGTTAAVASDQEGGSAFRVEARATWTKAGRSGE
jgi:hypothetical protein